MRIRKVYKPLLCNIFIEKMTEKNEILPTDNITQKFMKFGDVKDINIWKVVSGKNVKKHIFVKPLHRYWKKELTKIKTKNAI